MFTLLFLAVNLLCFENFVYGQRAVDQAFKRERIVPEILDRAPSDTLDVFFRKSGRRVNLGNEVTPNNSRSAPEVNFEAEWGSYYTLMMLDIDPPRRKNPSLRSFVNWLVTNIYETEGDVIMEYVGPMPLKFSEPHRIVLLLFKQPEKLTFDEEYRDAREVGPRAYFNVKKFARRYNLGDPIAANYFISEYDESVPALVRTFRA